MANAKNIKIHNGLVDLAVFVRCTWAAAYLNPNYSRTHLIRTYSQGAFKGFDYERTWANFNNLKERVQYKKRYFDFNYLTAEGFNYGITPGQIGVLTGEYFIDKEFGFVTDRREFLKDEKNTQYPNPDFGKKTPLCLVACPAHIL